MIDLQPTDTEYFFHASMEMRVSPQSLVNIDVASSSSFCERYIVRNERVYNVSPSSQKYWPDCTKVGFILCGCKSCVHMQAMFFYEAEVIYTSIKMWEAMFTLFFFFRFLFPTIFFFFFGFFFVFV